MYTFYIGICCYQLLAYIKQIDSNNIDTAQHLNTIFSSYSKGTNLFELEHKEVPSYYTNDADSETLHIFYLHRTSLTVKGV